VLKSSDILENIFSFLDTKSLLSVEECSELWTDVILKTSQWRKLSLFLSKMSTYNKKILQLKGIGESFEDKMLESNHFKKLCVGLSMLRHNYKHKVPTEVLLSCEASELKSQGINWDPNWTHQPGGWICNFKLDETRLVVGIVDTVQVWNVETKKCISILEPPDDEDREDPDESDITINALDILGNVLVVGSNDGIIRVWDLDSESLMKYLNCEDSGAVNALVFGKDSLLFSGHDDGKVMVWKVKSSSSIHLIQSLEEQSDIIWGLDVNDKFLVSCSEDCTVAVYNLPEDTNRFGEVYNSLVVAYKAVGHEQAVTCLKLQGALLVSGSRDKTVRLWRLSSDNYQALIVLKGHQELILCVNLDEERIYSSDKKGELIMWDLEEAQGKTDSTQSEQVIVRKLNFEERGGIDCIQINGSQIFTSYDNFGKISIHDFW